MPTRTILRSRVLEREDEYKDVPQHFGDDLLVLVRTDRARQRRCLGTSGRELVAQRNDRCRAGEARERASPIGPAELPVEALSLGKSGWNEHRLAEHNARISHVASQRAHLSIERDAPRTGGQETGADQIRGLGYRISAITLERSP